ncbi:unnamed protein product, partial [Effrenium voratum]
MCVHCISSLSMPAVLAEAKHFQQTLTLGTSPDVGALSVPAMRALGRRVEDFARKSCRAFPLEELYRLGRDDRPQLARLIHQEIAIRNAQLCKELLLLPFGLAETAGVRKVVECFSSYVDWLSEFPAPSKDDAAFTELLKQILKDNADITRTVGGAVLEVRSALGEAQYEEVRTEVDLILDRFFIKRIGLRFLIQHHIEAAEASSDGSGIIRSMEVGNVLRAAAAEARSAVVEEFGLAPQVEVIGDGAEIPLVHTNTYATGSSLSRPIPKQDCFTHVPSHVHFICFQLLRNACQAAVGNWKRRQCQEQRELLLAVASDAAAQQSQSVPLGRATVAGFPIMSRKLMQLPEGLAPVRAIFAHGREDVSIKVSDEGGGIPRSELQQAWSYYGTGDDRAAGVGLPLSRLHARYYGGDVVLKSMEGFGTDVYVFLDRLGQSCENLPQGVRLSPAQLDSSVGKEASIRAESLGDMSEAE